MSNKKVETEFSSEEKMERASKKNTRKKNNKRGKSKTKGTKSTSRQEVSAEGANDVAWYANNEQLLKASASFSYYTPVGSQINWNIPGRDALNIAVDPHYVPGIMTLHYATSPGKAEFFQDSVNVAADNNYSYVRFQNSGARNYDSPNLMLYYLAMDELYCAWAKAVRAYGCIRLYSQTNRYLPKALLKSQGWNPDDLIGNEAKFRGCINAIAAQISAFCVPAAMPYFARHFWMQSNIYTDNDVFKPQIYMYVCDCYRVYEEKAVDPILGKTGGFLQTYQWDDNLTIDDWMTVMNTMLNAVVKSEDIGIMSGDVLKAYGRENLFVLQAIDENYAVLPVYNEEVLSQIENFEITDIIRSRKVPQAEYNVIDTFNITEDPDTNLLYHVPSLVSQFPLASPHMLNFHKNDISPADAMVATRMKADFSMLNNDGDWFEWTVETCGSEIPLHATIWKVDPTTGDPVAETVFKGFPDNSTTLLQRVADATQFDWMPIIWSYTVTGADAARKWTFKNYFQDTANYTVLGYNQLRQTHTCAILSEFKIPTLGSF